MKTKIGLLGSTGRMGKWVRQLIENQYQQKAELVATPGTDEPFHDLLKSEVVIDFSSPAAVLKFLELTHATRGEPPALIVGSTGWRPEERLQLQSLAARTPVLISSNFSTGVLILNEVLRRASPLLLRMGYEPVIVESHHKHKKDQPSGTAISLQQMISPREPKRVQTHSIRMGETIGDHEVTFYGVADTISISHSAQDRSIFARGALDVALWLAQRRSGPRAIREVIGMERYFEDLIEPKVNS